MRGQSWSGLNRIGRKLFTELLKLRLRIQRSMDEAVRHNHPFCFTLLLIFTIVSLPVCCGFGMRTSHPFTVCITREFSYMVMSLHQTISTAIEAVDDNQVDNLLCDAFCPRFQTTSRHH